ncbi:MarR family winged helix-turn-helix transcriptional regulator [Undibacterium oligocarboniphilum]|uniref:MarR family transcriptional regulator n=1 Tax=Undibacterium oligocarboniphilum TaxID=666702 RepID=A0A850QEL7_9BURK|nr:MarR family transcriptional regulator [Undibacterium oligocarboniphilum]MBC3869744.1 MarR family transcriptional regulator [Undibacterium oligocarboniphilum]NVO77347.1 MarR family transcriptional regulator [Undibacterium oligocarboniphilum]
MPRKAVAQKKPSANLLSEQENAQSAAPDLRLETLKKIRIMIRAAQQHSLWIEKQCGINGAQLWIIQELQEAAGLRVGEIAKRLSIHQTTTSNLLDGLVKKGYVNKERDPEDQRVVKVHLTSQGKSLLKRAPQPARGLLPEAMRKMSDDSIVSLHAGLQEILDSMDALDEGFALLPLPFTM